MAELKTDVAELKTDVAELKGNVSTLLKHKQKMEHVEKRESAISETELNNAIREHLQRVYPGYAVRDLGDTFKSIKHHWTGKRLTEFDGIFELSQRVHETHDKRFIIVEAKRYVDCEKVEKKLAQLKILQKMIRVSKCRQLLSTTPAFRKTATALKLREYSPDVMLFIGAEMWECGAYEKALAGGAKTAKPSGKRFVVVDDMQVASQQLYASTGGRTVSPTRVARTP